MSGLQRAKFVDSQKAKSSVLKDEHGYEYRSGCPKVTRHTGTVDAVMLISAQQRLSPCSMRMKLSSSPLR